jgi:hypothetical protein
VKTIREHRATRRSFNWPEMGTPWASFGKPTRIGGALTICTSIGVGRKGFSDSGIRIELLELPCESRERIRRKIFAMDTGQNGQTLLDSNFHGGRHNNKNHVNAMY